MSIRSMTDLALERDKAPAKKQGVRRRGVPAAGDGPAADQLQKSRDVLVDAIPTEVLAPYTGLTAIIVSTIESGDSQHLALRWGIYAVGLAAIAAWLCSGYLWRRASDRHRRFPLLEVLTATVAFAAWGLVMPGSPLAAELGGGSTLTIWTAIITVAGGLVVAMLTSPLKKGAKTTA